MTESVSDRTQPRRRLFRRLVISLILVMIGGCGLLAVGIYRAGDPIRQITISPETTIYTEPLTPDGDLDVIAIWNELGSHGVTTGNNAALDLIRVADPYSASDVERLYGYFDLVPPQEEPPSRWMPSDLDLAQQYRDLGLRRSPSDQFWSDFVKCGDRPWTREGFPVISEVIRRNVKWYAAVAEASVKPKFFIPFGLDISVHVSFRTFADMLSARAMLHAGEGRLAEAWDDVIILERLAYLSSQAITSTDWHIGASLDAIASSAVVRIAESKALTTEQAERFIAELQDVEDIPPVRALLDDRIQLLFVWSVNERTRDGAALSEFWPETLREFLGNDVLAARMTNAAIDWDQTLITGRQYLADIAAAFEEEDPNIRSARLNRLSMEVGDWKDRLKDPSQAFVDGLLGSREEASHMMAAEMVGAQWITEYNNRDLRVISRRRLRLLALHLAAHRIRTGTYPEKLAELLSDRLKLLPADPVSGDEPQYVRMADDQCHVYMVGADGVDNGGRGAPQYCDDVAVWLGVPEESRYP